MSDTGDAADAGRDGTIVVHLGRVLEARGMTLTALAQHTGITFANLSVLKNGRGRAVRFSTLAALCHALDCQPGDLFTWQPPGDG
jgi:putative transcriptional regulator